MPARLANPTTVGRVRTRRKTSKIPHAAASHIRSRLPVGLWLRKNREKERNIPSHRRLSPCIPARDKVAKVQNTPAKNGREVACAFTLVRQVSQQCVAESAQAVVQYGPHGRQEKTKHQGEITPWRIWQIGPAAASQGGQGQQFPGQEHRPRTVEIHIKKGRTPTRASAAQSSSVR